jgi:hypothetical protein
MRGLKKIASGLWWLVRNYWVQIFFFCLGWWVCRVYMRFVLNSLT